MDSRVFCVYNLARGVFLSSKVTAADGVNEPLKILKVLVSGLGLDTESALWICPLSAIPAVPRLFPFDLLYLDRNQRVVDLVEIVPGGEFPPYRREVASALILARRTLESTKTGRGDRLIIGVADEIQREIAAADAFDLEPMVANSRATGGKINGFFDKNGREPRPAVSALLTEPFSPVVARLAESPMPVSEPADTRAVAIDSSASQSAADPAVGAVESEDRISASSQTEPDGVERDGVSATNPTEDPELTRLVSEVAGLSAGTAEKPIHATDSNSTRQISSEAKDLPGDKLATSILDADMEKENGNRLVITGQHGGLEDLFSNWVDAPSLTSAWMPRNPRPGSTAPTASTPSASSPEKSQSEADSKASSAVQSKPGAEPKKATSNVAGVPPVPVREKSEESTTAAKNTTTSGQPPVPAKTAVSQPHQATTFTAGTLGMWRVTMPTAVSPLGAVQSSDQTRPAAPVAEKESSSGKETNAKENPAPLAKSASFQTQASTASSRVTRASELPKAAESSVAANLEKIPARESATGSRERLSEKVPEKTERPAPTTAGTDLDKVQLDAPAAKAGISAESVAAAPKQVKVESKAIAPANGTAPKAQLKPSNAGTESNGKSKIAPPSLGMRFKRWLNPVAPVAGDRRRAHRRYVPGMVAHYYTGGAPTPHEVADISMTGFYLLTEDRWMPETMIQMSLQKPCAKGERKQCITVLSKIVRRGSDGVAAQFVMPEDLNPLSHDVQPSQATDKFSLARFL
jgi:hypothetical protein